jgi:hypothetical protein
MERVTGAGNKRVSLAALIAVKPGCRPRLIYRVHAGRGRGSGPLVVIWGNLNAHVSTDSSARPGSAPNQTPVDPDPRLPVSCNRFSGLCV